MSTHISNEMVKLVGVVNPLVSMSDFHKKESTDFYMHLQSSQIFLERIDKTIIAVDFNVSSLTSNPNYIVAKKSIIFSSLTLDEVKNIDDIFLPIKDTQVEILSLYNDTNDLFVYSTNCGDYTDSSGFYFINLSLLFNDVDNYNYEAFFELEMKKKKMILEIRK